MKRVSLAVVGIMLLAVSMTDSPTSARVRPVRPVQPVAPAVAGQSPAQTLYDQGNLKEAYELFAKQALSPETDPKAVGTAMHMAVNSLANLSRTDEIDAFRENVIKIHAGNWRLLQAAAQNYLNVDHGGFMVAGQFQRGGHRGGGKYVNSYERDRVRALQLMEQAIPLTKAEPAGGEVAQFYLAFSQMLMGNRGYAEAWRLGYLTDLTKLPDYEEGGGYGWGYGGGAARGAPVDEKGDPIYHSLPKTWQAAATDGQRWRWCLLQAVEFSPALKTQVMLQFGEFLQNQFGEQTLAYYGRRFAGASDEAKVESSGTWELHTLADDETIAKLATGVRRFKLPEEFNFIRIYQSLEEKDPQACTRLCEIYENRRQYPKAAEQWRSAISRFGPHEDRQRRLDQIVGSWGTFEPIVTQPAGTGASVEFRFRDGKKVDFTAKAIDVQALLADVKAYLKSNPNQLDWQKMQIENLGHRLVRENGAKYVGEQVATWSLALEPRANHWDRRITVATPLQKAGAYLVTSKMDDGNTTDIVLWVADTAVVTKPMADKPYYYIADAVTGKPVVGANVEFFGYHQEYVGDKPESRGHYVITTKQFAETTDADGQVRPDPKDMTPDHTWLVTATTPGGRLAYLGFSGVWGGRGWYDQEYNAIKTFVMTDRPVYRPKQKVNFKFWVNAAKYDLEGKSAYAGHPFTINITNPMGQKVHEGKSTADDYGGFDGTFELKEDAALGMYSVRIIHVPGGGGSFRVEEYKKPEFEVKVEAPSEPVALGDKFSALVKAKYYFGAPVTDAKVSYKVLRNDHSSRWFAPCPWDWLFEPGYWWYCYDYPWYPGWAKWGCWRPVMVWWGGWHRPQPPEVVAEGQARIDKDGQFKVEIDTSVAKALYGDTDHRYEITAEVVDKSRRTIVGKGSVLVARDPFKVYAWVDSGHYRVGQDVQATFAARRLDGKGVKGEGVLKLFRVTYKDNKPVETEVESWKLATDDDGQAAQQLKAAQAGQYRLSYTVTDAAKHAIEGGYVFVVRGEGFDAAGFRFNDVELVPDKAQYAPDEKVRLMVNTNRAGASVLLFLRPANGVYLPPVVLAMTGKSTVYEIPVTKKDMPNFFVEAVTIHSGKVHTDVRQIVVPPEKRILNVQVTAAEKVKPGEKTRVRIKLTDATGEPFVGSTVVTMYDKAVEYISGGSNSPEIKAFYWNWKRTHHAQTIHNLQRGEQVVLRQNQLPMNFIGVFGASLADEAEGLEQDHGKVVGLFGDRNGRPGVVLRAARAEAAADGPMPAAPMKMVAAKGEVAKDMAPDKPGEGEAAAPPMVE
ncbi:MAG: MG2 domain-containing protein, partial [Planctomycetota bacterium]